MGRLYRVAALCSLVWQNRNLSSFSPALNAYLDAIVSSVPRGGGYQLELFVALSTTDVPQSSRKPTPCPIGQSRSAQHDPKSERAAGIATVDRQRLLTVDSPRCPQLAPPRRPNTATMSFRPGSRIFTAFRTNYRQFYARRNASTAPGAEPTGFAKLWNSPVGPKTVHFWYAPDPHVQRPPPLAPPDWQLAVGDWQCLISGHRPEPHNHNHNHNHRQARHN